MRAGLYAVLLLAFSQTGMAEQYVCTYPGFGQDRKPVILKLRIEGGTAYDQRETYTVLENTKTGIVLVRSFAFHSTDRSRDEVGLFGVVINKSTLDMTRGSVIEGAADGRIRHGRCVR
jgi:hypothetical protein